VIGFVGRRVETCGLFFHPLLPFLRDAQRIHRYVETSSREKGRAGSGFVGTKIRVWSGERWLVERQVKLPAEKHVLKCGYPRLTTF
jgi:hypothetical protein